MDPLQVHLFGGFTVQRGGETLPPIPSRIGRSLFAYLVVNRHRGHARETLTAQFWPDLSETRGRRRLSHTLWQIQDSLGELSSEPYLEVTNETLAFNTNVSYWLDVEEFERCADAAGGERDDHPVQLARDLTRLRKAVELYRGDFLSGFYDEWVLDEQERLKLLYLSAVAQLVELEKSRSNYDEALVYARRLTHHDPLREDAHREVMRLCTLLGRTSEALLQYERCRSVLLEELGAEPAPATRSLYERIASQRGGRGAEPTPFETVDPLASRERPPFVGRDRERSVLVDRMEQVLSGRGGAVLVEGEPGVGKSRLVLEAADDAQWRGFSVMWGRSHEHASPRPYEAIAEALDGGLSAVRLEQLAHRLDDVWVDEAVRLVPHLARGNGQRTSTARLEGVEQSHRMRESASRLLLELGQIGPTMLVLEDLHWADDETLEVLEVLAGRLASSRLLVVLTYRAEDARRHERVWQAIRAIDRDCRPDRLLLAPLSTFGTVELARGALREFDLSTSFATRLHRETGGNPLFVLETLRLLKEQGRLDELRADQVPVEPDEDVELPVARSVHDLIAGRVAGLPEDTRRVLAACATIGVDLDLDTIARTAQLPRASVADSVDTLLWRGILEERGTGYVFGHDQTRRVVYDDLDPPTRRDLHRRVGEAIEALHPERVEALAHHFVEAHVPKRAFRYLHLAAERAVELHAYETASRHFARAVESMGRIPLSVDTELEVLAAYESVLALLARRDEQAELLDRMAELAAGNTRWEADVHRRRAWFFAHTDRFDEARTAAELALDLAPDDAARGAALTVSGTALLWAGDLPSAIENLEAAADAYIADPLALADAQFALGTALREVQRYDDASRVLEEGLKQFEALDDPRGQCLVVGALAGVAMECGNTESAERLYRRALELSRQIGFRQREGVTLTNLATTLYFRGNVAEAIETYRAAASVLRDIGNRRGEAINWLNWASVRFWIFGADTEAEYLAQLAMAYFEQIGDVRSQASIHETLGGIARLRGEFDVAREHLEGGLELARSAGSRWAEVHLLRGLGELELEGAELDAAMEHVRRAENLCDELRLEDLAVGLSALRGRIELRSGSIDVAIRSLETAVHALRPGVDRPHLVHFWHHLALDQAHAGKAARRALERAYESLAAALGGLSPEERARALAAVPEHQAIVDAWADQQPETRTIRIAAASAPTGRPLRSCELVSVEVTVEDPDDETIQDPIRRRQMRLLRIMEQATSQSGAPTVEDLAEILSVSTATIRRDLKALRERGFDAETRGSRSA